MSMSSNWSIEWNPPEIPENRVQKEDMESGGKGKTLQDYRHRHVAHIIDTSSCRSVNMPFVTHSYKIKDFGNNVGTDMYYPIKLKERFPSYLNIIVSNF